MDTETIDKLEEVFAPVAERIGQGAEFGYSVVLRQQYVSGVLGAVAFLIGLVVLVVIRKYAVPRMVRLSGQDRHSDWRFGARVLSIVGTIVCTTVMIAGLVNAITHFLNPHYYAIAFFMNLAK